MMMANRIGLWRRPIRSLAIGMVEQVFCLQAAIIVLFALHGWLCYSGVECWERWA